MDYFSSPPRVALLALVLLFPVSSGFPMELHISPQGNDSARGAGGVFLPGGGDGGNQLCVGMTVSHIPIHDTPSAGVLLGSYDRHYQFGPHKIRHNYMHSSNDGDALYFHHDHSKIMVFGNIAHL